jgi:hypothetical protein
LRADAAGERSGRREGELEKIAARRGRKARRGRTCDGRPPSSGTPRPWSSSSSSRHAAARASRRARAPAGAASAPRGATRGHESSSLGEPWGGPRRRGARARGNAREGEHANRGGRVRGGSRCARAPADPRRVCAREGMAGATRNSLETSVPKAVPTMGCPNPAITLKLSRLRHAARPATPRSKKQRRRNT